MNKKVLILMWQGSFDKSSLFNLININSKLIIKKN